MKKNVGHVSRNDSGEIHISVHEIHGDLYLNLRIYSRPSSDEGTSETEAIIIPIRMLPDLCETLEQTKADLVKEGFVDVPFHPTGTEARKPVFVLRAEQPSSQPERRNESPVPVRLPVECRLLSAPKSWSTKPATDPVTGETKDLSTGGAQVCLPEQFPIGTHLAVFMRSGDLTFRAQAEVMGVVSDPQHGRYRHKLHWMVLDDQARTTLLQMMEAAAHVITPQT